MNLIIITNFSNSIFKLVLSICVRVVHATHTEPIYTSTQDSKGNQHPKWIKRLSDMLKYICYHIEMLSAERDVIRYGAPYLSILSGWTSNVFYQTACACAYATNSRRNDEMLTQPKMIDCWSRKFHLPNYQVLLNVWCLCNL